ncbi:tetratricopeptide repeat protein [Micromonospora sp. WMMD730]|uniref:tetratricopeptide repeat protein n=1 Tax=Micromonospora sp. WMMD730 TaxID=3404128 RepID=UPI003B92FD1D
MERGGRGGRGGKPYPAGIESGLSEPGAPPALTSGTWIQARDGGIAARSINNVYQHFHERTTTVRLDQPQSVEKWTAQQLGVHPAIPGSSTPDVDQGFVLPAYLERDHDQRLRNHLLAAARGGQTMLVLVRGASCTGKTRTAFEAVRTCLAGWQLVYPKTPRGLRVLLDIGAVAPRTVVWLNEAQNYLTGLGGEQTAATLHTRLEAPGPVVILGTLWPEYHHDLIATPQANHGQGKHDAHPNARLLLNQAILVDVPACFTAESLQQPVVSRDPSLATAVRASAEGRITQTLAAGPQLVDHYEQAIEPHGPYGNAVITAAMDARRLGHTSPLPAELLKAAAPGYLTEQQRAAADTDTWFDSALAYARQKVRGVAAALEPVATPNGIGALPDTYRLSDYLDNYARTTRLDVFPPGSFWTAVQDHAARAADLHSLANAAYSRARYRITADLYERAADAGHSQFWALDEVARWCEKAGDVKSAERLYWRAADAGDRRALMSLALIREDAGDTEEAERLALRAADGGSTYALTLLAEQRRQAGNTEGAERLYWRAADAGDRRALMSLALIREDAGDTEEAERLALRAADAGERDALEKLAKQRTQANRRAGWRDSEGVARLYQRAAATGNPSALAHLALPLEWAGDRESAEQYALRAADANYTFPLTTLALIRERAGERETAERLALHAACAGEIYAVTKMADWRERAGDIEGTERLYQHAADTGNTRVVDMLVEARANAGSASGAERLALRAAAAGNTSALTSLARRREKAGDIEGAERLFHRAANTGDTPALMSLARLREKAGDIDGAEQLYQRAAGAGNTWGAYALTQLARLREEDADVDGAEQLYRQAANMGETNALTWLALQAEQAGNAERAERLALQLAVGSGTSTTLWELARLRKKAGDAEGLERLYQRATNAGVRNALEDLARLREQAGDAEAAEQLKRFGLEADGSPHQPKNPT